MAASKLGSDGPACAIDACNLRCFELCWNLLNPLWLPVIVIRNSHKIDDLGCTFGLGHLILLAQVDVHCHHPSERHFWNSLFSFTTAISLGISRNATLSGTRLGQDMVALGLLDLERMGCSWIPGPAAEYQTSNTTMAKLGQGTQSELKAQR